MKKVVCLMAVTLFLLVLMGCFLTLVRLLSSILNLVSAEPFPIETSATATLPAETTSTPEVMIPTETITFPAPPVHVCTLQTFKHIIDPTCEGEGAIISYEKMCCELVTIEDITRTPIPALGHDIIGSTEENCTVKICSRCDKHISTNEKHDYALVDDEWAWVYKCVNCEATKSVHFDDCTCIRCYH